MYQLFYAMAYSGKLQNSGFSPAFLLGQAVACIFHHKQKSKKSPSCKTVYSTLQDFHG